MVKKVYFYILIFFSVFVFMIVLSNFWLYKKESQTIKSITSSYQYSFIIDEIVYNKIYLINHILTKYYKTLLKIEVKKKIILTENNIDKLVTLLKSLQKLGFKNYKSFLFKYIYNIYDEDIDIIQNGKIIISKNFSKIGKDFDYACNPFANYGKCSIIKNNKFHIIKYSPAYKLLIESDFNLKKFNKEKISENLIAMLKSIPKIIVYHNGKKIIGKFNNNEFYIFDEFKPLNILFGFGIKYNEIDQLSNIINNEVLKAIKPLLYSFGVVFIIIILIMYFILFTVFRKKIIFIEKVLNEYNKKASIDKLTGVYNRFGFENELENRKCKYFLISDIDHFKYINDTFGHKTGDKILKEFAWLLKKYFKNDIIGRWGGDEFLICTNKEKKQILSIIETINENLKEIQKHIDPQMSKKISVSTGACGNSLVDIQKRFNNADLALYKVKKTKKGNILFFSDIDYIKIEKEDINK